MSWSEKFKHPGEAPPRPESGAVEAALNESPLDKDKYKAACAAQRKWNDYVFALRKHRVALAVDALDDKQTADRPPGVVGLWPPEIVAQVLGTAFLEGTLDCKEPDPLGALLGAFPFNIFGKL